MTRITLLVAAVALATAACSGSSTPVGTASATDTTAAGTGAEAVAPSTAPVATEQPQATATMTWDGTNCTYNGPTVVPRRTRLTVTLANTPDALSGGRDGAGFLLFRVDDGISQQDFDAWTKVHPKGSDVPPWVDQLGLQIVYPDQVTDGLPLVGRDLTANRYMVTCSETPKDGEAMHLGAIIDVKDR